ncbi:MAG TPA: YgiQ family radical SAM protein [Kofleriaceae bacterium]|nr:YgiQ family radical SAM protein [Kofleriaceae bacterium]
MARGLERPAPTAAPAATPLFSHRKHWAHRFGTAPFLPMSREEMADLGWDSCDIVIVTGDAYVDHPSFGMAIVGRLLEAQGFRVGILAQPDWHSAEPFRALGRPNLFFGVTGGNMDSMVNRYTSERRIRSDDAYSPGGRAGLRPDRSVVVYAQRCREAFRGVPVVVGGIEASLRRIAHYDYWSDKVRRSILVDSKADLLLYGNAERAVVELAHRLAAGTPIAEVRDLRGTAHLTRGVPDGWTEIDSTSVDRPGTAPVLPRPDPYAAAPDQPSAPCASGGDRAPETPLIPLLSRRPPARDRDRTAVRIPSFEEVVGDPVLYAHASRVLHLESNPGNARALIQRHGDRDVFIAPPPVPLTTAEMDALYELPFQRVPHPFYAGEGIPAYEMIRFSVTIMRGCFGGCTFCSITEHEGRIIQNRSEGSILREVEAIRDRTPGYTGIISDLGGPTANMWRLACKTREIEAACRKPSCVYPDICGNLGTDHTPLIRLYRKARALPGVKRVFVASGLRYDLAVRSPEYVSELARHHVGGYLKIAPEHTQEGPLRHMMKPGVGAYDRFKELFDRASAQAGKEQYLIPYFIAAHPGTRDEDMLELALWLKRNRFRPDQVQAFLPSPMATATAMYHTGFNPLRALVSRTRVDVARSREQRRLHKAFLRYHDPENWPILREALVRMGREDLIGNGKRHLVPRWQPAGTGRRPEGRRNTRGQRPAPGTALTQHTGLPPMPHEPRQPRQPRDNAERRPPRRR